MMEGDNKPVYEQRFSAAVRVIQNLPSNGEAILSLLSHRKKRTQRLVSHLPKNILQRVAQPVIRFRGQLLFHVVPGRFGQLLSLKWNHYFKTAFWFGSMLTSPPKSVTKSIIRTMEMNGSLDSYPIKISEIPKAKSIDTEDGEDDNEEEEEEKDEEEEVKEVKKGRPKGQVSNGSIGQHKVLDNGTHGSKSDLNRQDSYLNRSESLFICETEDVSSSHHVASDSDSEVYCDSIDQFGAEEGSELHVSHSLDVAEESHSTLSSTGEIRSQEELLGQEEGMQHGGEDGPSSRSGSQRQGLPANRSDSSVVRRGRGSRSPAFGSGSAGPQQGSGGDGERSGTDGSATQNLNEQIICALARLQDDMQSVLERLQTLEALTASQARSLALSSDYLSPPANKTKKKPSWWPFDVSPGTVAFAVIWPFVVQWLIRLYVQRRRR
uniref:Acyl-CoA-binding domain-containing protein 5A-like n=1 Tax=Sinocyclocheilus anshuiensis TaxID=1608454 RepID=A0A671Q9B5_9TELE